MRRRCYRMLFGLAAALSAFAGAMVALTAQDGAPTYVVYGMLAVLAFIGASTACATAVIIRCLRPMAIAWRLGMEHARQEATDRRAHLHAVSARS